MNHEIRAEVVRLLAQGRPVYCISERLGVHEAAVRRIGYEERIIKLEKSPNGPNNRDLNEFDTSNFNGNYFQEAVATLGHRYEERNGSMWLRGRPANIDDVMIEANRLRVLKSLPQIGTLKKWRAIELSDPLHPHNQQPPSE